jgi:hypothetical protein
VQGVIFVAIHQRLRELGDDELRKECFPEPVLAFRDYPDAELVRIARIVAERVPAMAPSLPDVLRSLGEEVVGALAQTNPAILPAAASLADLLALLRDDATDPRFVLPRMKVEREADGRVELVHTGDASVCRFDEGLLIGLATAAGERIATRHPSCRARRDERCVFIPRVLTGTPGRRVSRTFRFEPPEEGDGG